MLILNTKVNNTNMIDDVLTLPYEQRRKSRLKTKLISGEEVAVFNVRGSILRHGDLFRADNGRVIQIRAAFEDTYRIESNTILNLLCCAFHLGNRHTQVQLGMCNHNPFLRIQVDIILKDMLQKLGAHVIEEAAKFEPEAGAYNNT